MVIVPLPAFFVTMSLISFNGMANFSLTYFVSMMNNPNLHDLSNFSFPGKDIRSKFIFIPLKLVTFVHSENKIPDEIFNVDQIELS